MTDQIQIRKCTTLGEFYRCVELQKAVWNECDLETEPYVTFVVANQTGGQVLGAFDGDTMIGFTMAVAGVRNNTPYLHSHMTGVLADYRDRRVGRALKLFQREEALSRGIKLIEWTFDPLVPRNAYFNFMRLGAVARRYVPNAYGITTSPLHGSLPTDRLVAEWHLESDRVRRVLTGEKTPAPRAKKLPRISVPSNIDELRADHPSGAREVQAEVRVAFQQWFAAGYAATAIVPSTAAFDYILEPHNPS